MYLSDSSRRDEPNNLRRPEFCVVANFTQEFEGGPPCRRRPAPRRHLGSGQRQAGRPQPGGCCSLACLVARSQAPGAGRTRTATTTTTTSARRPPRPRPCRPRRRPGRRLPRRPAASCAPLRCALPLPSPCVSAGRPYAAASSSLARWPAPELTGWHTRPPAAARRYISNNSRTTYYWQPKPRPYWEAESFCQALRGWLVTYEVRRLRGPCLHGCGAARAASLHGGACARPADIPAPVPADAGGAAGGGEGVCPEEGAAQGPGVLLDGPPGGCRQPSLGRSRGQLGGSLACTLTWSEG
jgi:hypothetical protein